MKKFISMLLAGLLLTGLFILAGCGGSDNSAEIDALKKQIAALQQQIQDMESGSGGGSSEAQIAQLNRQIGFLNETIAALQTAVGNVSDENKAEVKQLKDQLASLQTDLNNTKARVLLLEGKVDGDPNKVYHLGDTVSYSSNGMKLFEIKVYAITSFTAGGTSTLVLSLTYTNFNMAAKLALDQIYTPILVESNGYISKTTASFSSSKYVVNMGDTIDLSPDNDNHALTFYISSLSGLKKLYFGIYNKVDNQGSFIPFACYDLELNGLN